MSSKRRREKSYSIHGMQSILSAFINRHQFAIKPYDSYGTNRATMIPMGQIGQALVVYSDISNSSDM